MDEDPRRSEATEGMVAKHLAFQQKARIREENLVQTQARRAQFRGSSSSLDKILRTKSSESFPNRVSAISVGRGVSIWLWEFCWASEVRSCGFNYGSVRCLIQKESFSSQKERKKKKNRERERFKKKALLVRGGEERTVGW